MHVSQTHALTWHGQAFRFHCMPSRRPRDRPVWAVVRRGEFIGIMPCGAEVTTKEFEARALRWITDLLRGSPEP
jgi:hypothetical protein